MEIRVMIDKIFIENSLKEYFMKKGCKIVFPSEFDEKISEYLKNNVDLIFRDARNLILIKIFSFPSIESYTELKNLLHKTILSLTKFSSLADKIYLATYENNKLFAIVRSEIFYNSGIGLITVDVDGHINEKIPSTLYNVYPLRSEVKIEGVIQRYMEGINDRMKEVYSTLESLKKSIDNIYIELENIKTRLKELEERRFKREMLTNVPIMSEEIQEASEKDMEDLPDFVRRNPWLNVLRKRGKYSNE